MKPEYVLEARARGLKLPFLQSLVEHGAYADGVVGVWPTVTYPSHTTLVTGVTPAEHGIVANLEFDPERRFDGAWYWYAPQIRVPTLWSAAHAAGLSTASVGWPVSVAADGVDYLIPEYWRASAAASQDADPSDRELIAALSLPNGLLTSMQARLGPYMAGNDTSLAGDSVKTRFAIDILQRHKPAFMTLHLSSLDEAEHEHGPFSGAANATLEGIDALLAELSAAMRHNYPAAAIVVVSDHGFLTLSHRVNLTVPFVQRGFISTAAQAGQTPTITGWQAAPWLAGGMAAVMLKQPAEPRLEAEVGNLLADLAADPKNGISAIFARDAIKQRGAFPDAAFLVVLAPGYYAGSALSGPLVTDIPATDGGMPGGHGFSPDDPSMRAAFFAAGSGLARHDLGVIDMRRIAPTVAQLLGVALPSAALAPLPLQE